MARKSRKHLFTVQESQSQKTIHTNIAGAYLRISKEDKDQQNSIESQRLFIEDFELKTPDILIHKYYVDNGVSAFKSHRPAFIEMISDMHEGKINCIIVKDLSRFGRDYIEVGTYLDYIFPLENIRLISLLDNYDSHVDKMILPLLVKSIFNHSYSHDLSDKIRSTINLKQMQGTYIPAKLPYGYKKSCDNNKTTYVIDYEASKIVKKIFSLSQEGMSCYQIAGELNSLSISTPAQYRKSENINNFVDIGRWQSGTVRRILTDNTYIGYQITNKSHNNLQLKKAVLYPHQSWIIIPNHHEAIIDAETFETVQRNLSEYIRPENKSSLREYWAANLYCGKCGRKMVRKNQNDLDKLQTHYYYVCSQKDNASDGCTVKSISSNKLKNLLFLEISNKIAEQIIERDKNGTHEQSIQYKLKNLLMEQEISKQKKKLLKISSGAEIVFEKYVDGFYTKDDYRRIQFYRNPLIEQLRTEMERLEEEQRNYVERCSPNRPSIQAFLNFNNCKKLNKDMYQLIKRCTWDGRCLNITWSV